MKPIIDLLQNHRKQRNLASNTKKMTFLGVEDLDVYNTSNCFMLNKMSLIAGRVEERDSELSTTRLFKMIDHNVYEILPNFSLPLQDPFITVLNNKVVLGGVRVDWTNLDRPTWRTEFYLLSDDFKTKLILTGPKNMKDIRFLELKNGKILMLTRPQGGEAEFGKIGILTKNHLSEFDEQEIADAPLLKNNFNKNTWGGANQIIQVSENVVQVIGHIAEMKHEERHYYSLSFYVDLLDQYIFDEHIIAERQDFIAGPTKRDDLADVVFSSGINIDSNGHKFLLCGTSDCEEQSIELI